jgi:hypothetical protein
MASSANAGIKTYDKDGVLFPTPSASAEASAYKSVDDFNATTELLKASAGASAGSYTGVDASAHLVTYGHENGEFKLGAGISTGVGVRDSTLEIKVLGFGIRLGKNIGISLLDNDATWKNAIRPDSESFNVFNTVICI